MSEAVPVKIVLATDGSAHSRAAEDLLAGLRWPPGSTATVLAVERQPWSLLGLGLRSAAETHDTLARLQRVARGAAHATAYGAASRLGQAGLATVTVVGEGTAAQALLGLAAEARADLIALGAKGFSQFNVPRLGSTAWEVFHAAQTSVLIARPGRHSAPARIVLAADGLMDWLAPGAWPLTLLPPSADVTVARLAPEGEATDDCEAADLRAVEFGEALQAQGLRVRNVFPHDEPRAELIRLARAAEADLVIVAGQTSPAPGEGTPGSWAPAVAKYAPCSVLVVRPGHSLPRHSVQLSAGLAARSAEPVLIT